MSMQGATRGEVMTYARELVEKQVPGYAGRRWLVGSPPDSYGCSDWHMELHVLEGSPPKGFLLVHTREEGRCGSVQALDELYKPIGKIQFWRRVENDYHNESREMLERFFEDKCEFGSRLDHDYFVSIQALYKSYCDWCVTKNVSQLRSRTIFKRGIRFFFPHKIKMKCTDAVCGVRLRPVEAS